MSLQSKTSVTREELYEQVWTTPIKKLAASYGVSNTAIAKACRRMGVPTPPRGYWMKIAVGKKPRKGPLPSLQEGLESSATFYPQIAVISPGASEGTVVPSVTIPEDLRGCHPLVSSARAALERDTPSSRGLRATHGPGMLSICVSKGSMHRALRLTEALLRAAEQAGWKVEGGKEVASIMIHVGDDEVELSVSEGITRAEIDDPKAVKDHWWRPSYKEEPNGLLTVQITNYIPTKGIRRTWSDGKIQRLEKLFPEIIAGIDAVAQSRRPWRLELEKWRRQCEEKERMRKELAARIAKEKQRREELLRQSAGFRKAADIRELIATARSRLLKDDAAEWFDWAEQIANQHDPFRNGYLEKALSNSGFEPALDCSVAVNAY